MQRIKRLKGLSELIALQVRKESVMAVQDFWVRFLKSTGRGPEQIYRDCFRFAYDENTSNELLGLVLAGKKEATASCFPAYQASNTKPPIPGELNIITDWQGTPRAVIETTSVIVIPFIEVKQDIIDREGEGLTVEAWRKEHRKLFEEEAKNRACYKIDDYTPIIFENFKLIYSEEAPKGR